MECFYYQVHSKYPFSWVTYIQITIIKYTWLNKNSISIKSEKMRNYNRPSFGKNTEQKYLSCSILQNGNTTRWKSINCLNFFWCFDHLLFFDVRFLFHVPCWLILFYFFPFFREILLGYNTGALYQLLITSLWIFFFILCKLIHPYSEIDGFFCMVWGVAHFWI